MLFSVIVGVKGDLSPAIVLGLVLLMFVVFKRFTLVKEALIEIGCVVTSLVVGWLSRACTVAKRCILGL